MRLPCGVFNYSYSEDMAIIRTKTQWGLFIGFLIFIGLVPLFAPTYITGIIVGIFIYIVVAQSLQLLTGYCGQISMAHSAFMGVGAFTTGIVVAKLGLSFWAALPLAGIVAGLVGLIFGVPSFRVKGLYLVLISIAAQIIIMYAILHLKGVTGGVTGLRIPPPTIGSFVFGTTASYYYLAGATAAVTTFLIKNIVRTRAGRAFIAIRDNDIAADVMGVNIFGYKLLAFFISCFFAGIAGWLWGGYTNLASVDHYNLMESIWFLAMIVVGGLGSTLGAILGVVFIEVLRELCVWLGPVVDEVIPVIGGTISTAMPMFVLGLVIMMSLILEPRGLAHRWEIIKRSYRLWPYSR